MDMSRTIGSILKQVQSKYRLLLEKEASCTKFIIKRKEMKTVMDNFLNFSQNMGELQANSKLDQIMFIEKDIQKVLDSVHSTKDMLVRLEKVQSLPLDQEQFMSGELAQRIQKVRIRARAQERDLNDIIDLYYGLLQLINATIMRKV